MKTGQKLLCINRKGWHGELGEKTRGPKYNEVVTFFKEGTDPMFLILEEYKHVNDGPLEFDEYTKHSFIPLPPDEVLESELSEILSSTLSKSECL